MPIPFKLIYEYEDRTGRRSTSGFHIPNSFTLVQVTEAAKSFASLIDAIVHGLIAKCSLGIEVDISGLTNNFAVADSDVEEVGMFVFDTVGGAPIETNIPGIKEDQVVLGTDELDQSEVNVAAFIAGMENGIAVTLGTVQFCATDERLVDTVRTAREGFRATGRSA